MGNKLRYPNINGKNEREMLVQMKSYLFQLVDELEFAIDSAGTSSTNVVNSATKSTQAPTSTVDAVASFSAIKSLIIKSADIVDAYYQKMSTRFEGAYIAKSDFGTFVEQTTQDIEQNATSVTQLFTNLQQIITDIDNLEFTLAEVDAHIKTGLLDYEGGVPVYGLEIGQKNTIDGNEVYNKYARFTADRLSFYDQNDTEAAYISDDKLYIRNVEVKVSLQEGGYKDFISANGGIVTKWVGGDN